MDDNTSVKIMYEDLREQASTQFSEEELVVLDKAFQVANEKHKEQKRSSGEPYIIHPVSVAKIVLDYGMDCASVVAALLHDTVEDTDLTLEEIDEIFGEEITHLVDGLTKLGKVPLDIKDKEAVKKVQNDVRAVLIHAQTITPEQLQECKELGINISFFVDHVYYYGDYHLYSTLGPDRGQYVSPMADAMAEDMQDSQDDHIFYPK